MCVCVPYWLLLLFFFAALKLWYLYQCSETDSYFWCQRLAIELFRRQTSRSSSPPDLRLAAGTTASERDPRSVKSDDDIQTTLSNTKKGEEEERTQHDDSNVREKFMTSGDLLLLDWLCLVNWIVVLWGEQKVKNGN